MALKYLVIADEVQAALEARRPVVALESTLVAHGLPWPESYEVGRALEDEVRRHGAVPATVAVVRGQVVVGIDAATLERMARAQTGPEEARWRKAGVADLAPLCARGADGATTVSATTFAAARAGLRLFATGGIGGVHRGDGMDVSSDLTTLAREPVAVVSAGCKAILDLPRTLEALETLGVLTVGVRTSELPAFYTRSSGLPLEHRVDSPEETARLLHAHWTLREGAGVLLANPIPKAHELDRELIDRAIAAALDEAARAGVRGKALTPFMLASVARATHKRSLGANRALAISNAGFAAQVAMALCQLPPLS
ncbi:MAG TPA: pseudouridine-5'-phosphate glycosidase [Polyangia bacterium]|jgi:pseudouridine-5'-phosphate glycosidase